ncbi:type III secretion system protein PrgR [Enterococcus faecalis]|uniref:type III secretion system protein PrgR n=1 Tax=Enterococcus faecalis TaxID=1351 RepID=UPI000C774AD6|nr:type III secretion system protein PrgR [Enterococcus faecalis]PLA79783.1 type III secretion system protein PrgR [Enterococcus faecalis]
MKVKAEHLKVFCCEVTLFNRQRWQFFSDQTVRRIIIDLSGKKRVILTKKLIGKKEHEAFLAQIKSIYFNGKIVACRGCSQQALILSNMEFAKMKKRFILLRKANKIVSKQGNPAKQRKEKNK